MYPDAASPTMLRAPGAVRAGWRLLVTLPLALFVLSVPARYGELAELARRASSQLGSSGGGLLQRYLAEPAYYALTALSLEVVFVLAFTLTSLAIVWRNQTDWRPLFFSAVFVFYSVCHPSWSPDGRRIAYVHSHEADGGGQTPDIWAMSPTGGGKSSISNNDSTVDTQPAWSPLGDKIAYVADGNIAVMNATNGSGQGPIDTNSANDIEPDWQPIPVCTKTVKDSNDPLVGTAGKDVLCGNNLNNTINGAGGNDIILAGGGSDKLTGGLGNDTINGGSGKDTALHPGSTCVTANLTTEFAKGVGMDVLLGTENLSGSNAKDTLTGSASSTNVLNGLGGNDILNVRDGTGGDTANGGTGTDTCRKDVADVQKSCP